MTQKRQRTSPDLRGDHMEVNKILADLEEESDRATALIAITYFDAQLREILKDFLVPGAGEVNKLFELNNPLGGFDAKMRMAYYLGLISMREYQDLKIIQWI